MSGRRGRRGAGATGATGAATYRRRASRRRLGSLSGGHRTHARVQRLCYWALVRGFGLCGVDLGSVLLVSPKVVVL